MTQKSKIKPLPICQQIVLFLSRIKVCQFREPEVSDREFKSREVAQAPIYVIVHSLLELSFCTQPFPTPSGWLCWCVLTLVMALWRSINFVLLLLFLTLGRYDAERV